MRRVALQAAERRKMYEFFVGPTVGAATDVGEVVFTDARADFDAWKRLLYRHGPLGAVARHAIEGPP